mmetsp:Transcript_36607/g.97962  ORF Transcript_36607/g.97962 Transcript_36607/m.97962 type:complete len:267 (+) Transcript_36607:169-969(+)
MRPSNVTTVDAAVAFLRHDVDDVHVDGSAGVWSLLFHEEFCVRLGVDPATMRSAVRACQVTPPIQQLEDLLRADTIVDMRDVSKLPPHVGAAVTAAYDIRDSAIHYGTDPKNAGIFRNEPSCWPGDGSHFDPMAFADYGHLVTHTHVMHLRGIAGFYETDIYVVVDVNFAISGGHTDYHYHCVVCKYDGDTMYVRAESSAAPRMPCTLPCAPHTSSPRVPRNPSRPPGTRWSTWSTCALPSRSRARTGGAFLSAFCTTMPRSTTGR